VPAKGVSSLPALQWLVVYDASTFRFDAIAGLTLAAYAVPVSMAYATLAGLPPETGLYCYLVAGLGYALLGTSRQLAVGPTSAIALLLGVSLAELTAGNLHRQATLASTTALLMAGVFLVAWLLRLSVLVNFISESILTGFKAGAALVIASTQLPKLLGVRGGGDDFFERAWLVVRQSGETNSATLLLGAAAIAMLLVGERWFPRRPVSLFVVLSAILVTALFQLDSKGVRIVGTIPQGLPAFHWTGGELISLERNDIRQLTRLAAACFLLSYIESVSAARTFALKHRYEVDARQELLGLAAANFLVSLFHGFPIAGGLSQSAVNDRSGAKTPLALLIASAAIACVLLLLTGFFRTLPDAVLAAIVLVAVKGLINLEELWHLWRVNRLDFAAAGVALAGVLLMGVLDGVLIAVVASLGMLLWRVSRPQVAVLGRIPGTNRFSDIARHPNNETLADVLAVRLQSSLLYFNAEHVLKLIREHTRSKDSLRRVICDLSNTPYVDISGARMLKRLAEELRAHQIDFHIVEPHALVRDILRAEGLEELVGPITRRSEVMDFWGLAT
jgi:high affinity sulfate transporter 1